MCVDLYHQFWLIHLKILYSVMHLKEEIPGFLFRKFTDFQEDVLLFCKKKGWVDNEFDPCLYTYMYLVVVKETEDNISVCIISIQCI